MTNDPYRPSALAIVQTTRVEAAVCEWCRWGTIGSTCAVLCFHPLSRNTNDSSAFQHCHGVKGINPRGECSLWSPSWLTRWMRRLRLGRAPAMVDPQVWDKPEKAA